MLNNNFSLKKTPGPPINLMVTPLLCFGRTLLYLQVPGPILGSSNCKQLGREILRCYRLCYNSFSGHQLTSIHWCVKGRHNNVTEVCLCNVGDKPVSHCRPVNPAGQVHLYPRWRSSHSPAFWQGMLSQSSISVRILFYVLNFLPQINMHFTSKCYCAMFIMSAMCSGTSHMSVGDCHLITYTHTFTSPVASLIAFVAHTHVRTNCVGAFAIAITDIWHF